MPDENPSGVVISLSSPSSSTFEEGLTVDGSDGEYSVWAYMVDLSDDGENWVDAWSDEEGEFALTSKADSSITIDAEIPITGGTSGGEEHELSGSLRMDGVVATHCSNPIIFQNE